MNWSALEDDACESLLESLAAAVAAGSGVVPRMASRVASVRESCVCVGGGSGASATAAGGAGAGSGGGRVVTVVVDVSEPPSSALAGGGEGGERR